MVTIHRTYQYRAYTGKAGYERIAEVLRECATLYNAALQQWRTAYNQSGVKISMFDQLKQFTLVRRDDAFWGGVSAQIGRAGRCAALKERDKATLAEWKRTSSAALNRSRVTRAISQVGAGIPLNWQK